MATMTGEPTLFEKMGVKKLDDHWQLVLASAVFWQLVWSIGWLVSAQVSRSFRKMDAYKKYDWCIHIVSFVHAATIVVMALYNFTDPVLIADKIFGYTPRGAQKPFLQYYGTIFLMFELSTPFLNIHWFCDKTGRTGSTLQWVNGMVLLFVFFVARIVFGLYQSYQFFAGMIAARSQISLHLFLIYTIANVVLNTLNIFWFRKMILSVTKRFKKTKNAEKKTQ
ncbi:hypothetical protein HDV05_002678 [Chytridiales sp. JEL 0842]|nr:hypothetical protein HDV05_002678 [Chytridiales sp. JEL 0842]